MNICDPHVWPVNFLPQWKSRHELPRNDSIPRFPAPCACHQGPRIVVDEVRSMYLERTQLGRSGRPGRAQIVLLGAAEPMGIEAVLAAPNGGYSRRRAKAEVAVRGGFRPGLAELGPATRWHGPGRAVPVMLGPCGAVTSTGGAVSRWMLGDRRHVAMPPAIPYSTISRVLGDGRSGPGGRLCRGPLRVASAVRRLTSWPGS
jgi:hypothetical protein